MVSSDLQPIRLNCLVLGDDPWFHIFSIKIARTESVGDLKKLIKEEKRPEIDAVAADRLKLWNVDLPVDDTLDRNMRRDIEHKLPLLPLAELSEVFSSLPEEGHLHIVVQTPDIFPPPPPTIPMFSLNCFVLGDDPKFHSFPIKIARTEIVSRLKKLIKEEKRPEFDAVAADCLQLWNVANLTVDDTLESNVRRDIEHKLPLLSLAELSEVFSSLPEEGHLHVVVQRPPAGISRSLLPLSYSERVVQESREAYAKNFPSGRPSSQGVPSVFNKTLQENNSFTIGWERPRSAASTIPTTLLHPIFGQFIDDCESHEPTKEDNDLVMALSEATCNFFDDDEKRASKFREILQEHRIDLIPSKIQHTKYETDGDIQYRGFRYAILEAKNELGATQAEPHMQAISCYIRSTLPLVGTKRGRFPCILITLFGPHIDFSGAVWIERPTIQVLSAALPLLYHHTDTKMRTFVARHVGALRKALRSLNEYCETMDSNASSPTLNPDLNPVTAFPFQRSYTCIETSSTLHFRYIYQMDNTKLIFAAQTMNKKMICVKFVRRYSMDVHKLCASEDLAPALYGLDYLPGGWYMVVMELFENDYICLRECSAPHSHQDEIAQKLEYLHQNGLVHGDIRDINIMVKKDGSSGIKLVDFDWSGKIGEIRYPMNVYRGEHLWRPDGAEDGQLIMAEHDVQMLRALFHGPH